MDIYNVVFSDNSSTRCTLDHLWSISSRYQKEDRQLFEVLPLEEILKHPLKRFKDRQDYNPGHNHSQYNNYIPIIGKLDLTPKGQPLAPLPIHPYLLGALIGDGGFTATQIRFISTDDYIIKKVQEYLLPGDCLVKDWSIGRDCSMRINGGATQKAIGELGLLNHKSPEKWIPEQYLWTTWQNRLALLQGLMDTDGTASGPTGGYPTFTTTSKRLAKDVRFLVQSLGGTSTTYLDKPSTGKYAGNYPLHKVNMRLPKGAVPFQLPRKADRFTAADHALPLRGIERITLLDKQEAKCIKISDPEGLYITDEFIVTHNTDLLLGAALTRHWRSIIFRREYAELKGIRERAEELYEPIGKFNGNQELWRIMQGEFQGKRIEFGACQYEGDERKFQGRAHDLKGFDEITQFTERQFRFLTTWNRTTRLRQRVRAIATGNPPVSAEGQWVVAYWAPWLDPRHPNPAKQGELRYFITVPEGSKKLRNAHTGDEIFGWNPGKDLEFVTKVEVLVEYGGDQDSEVVESKSRTFIKARVEDNPRLMETGYRRTLQNLPEPLRSMMLRGDFGVGHEDDEWQIIPTDWIYKAQARWAPTFEEFLAKQELAYKGSQITSEEVPNTTELSSDLRVQPHASSLAPYYEIPGTFGVAASPSVVKPTASHSSAQQAQQAPPVPDQAGPVQNHDRAAHQSSRTRIPEPPLPASLIGMGGTTERTNIGPIIEKRLQESRPAPAPAPSAPSFNLTERRKSAEKEGAIGVDVSRGGRDDSIISERLENWFGELKAIPGRQTTDGKEVIQTIVDLGFGGRRIHIDITGVGTAPVDVGKMMGMEIIPMVGSEKSNKKERSGRIGFVNARAEWWWGFREALDPILGDGIALPPDPGLLADLTAPRWSLAARGIQVEAKEHIKARLGRSPDKGDAVVMAYAQPYVVAEAYLKYLREQVEEMHQRDEDAQKERENRSWQAPSPPLPTPHTPANT